MRDPKTTTEILGALLAVMYHKQILSKEELKIITGFTDEELNDCITRREENEGNN